MLSIYLKVLFRLRIMRSSMCNWFMTSNLKIFEQNDVQLTFKPLYNFGINTRSHCRDIIRLKNSITFSKDYINYSKLSPILTKLQKNSKNYSVVIPENFTRCNSFILFRIYLNRLYSSKGSMQIKMQIKNMIKVQFDQMKLV